MNFSLTYIFLILQQLVYSLFPIICLACIIKIFSTKNSAFTHKSASLYKTNSKPNISFHYHKISPLEKILTSFYQNVYYTDYCNNSQPILHNQNTSHYSYDTPIDTDSLSQQNTNQNIEIKNNSHQKINTNVNSQSISTLFHDIHNSQIILDFETQEEIVNNNADNQLLSEVGIASSTLEDVTIQEYNIELLEMG